MGKQTIALDFDGVIHSYKSGWIAPDILEEPLEGSLEFFNKLLEKYKIVIFSARAKSPNGLLAIQNWLKKYNFPEVQVTPIKPNASLYIDDRGFRFNGCFKETLQFIEQNPSLQTWQHNNESH